MGFGVAGVDAERPSCVLASDLERFAWLDAIVITERKRARPA
jgi:hypothetical protein